MCLFPCVYEKEFNNLVEENNRFRKEIIICTKNYNIVLGELEDLKRQNNCHSDPKGCGHIPIQEIHLQPEWSNLNMWVSPFKSKDGK